MLFSQTPSIENPFSNLAGLRPIKPNQINIVIGRQFACVWCYIFDFFVLIAFNTKKIMKSENKTGPNLISFFPRYIFWLVCWIVSRLYRNIIPIYLTLSKHSPPGFLGLDLSFLLAARKKLIPANGNEFIKNNNHNTEFGKIFNPDLVLASYPNLEANISSDFCILYSPTTYFRYLLVGG